MKKFSISSVCILLLLCVTCGFTYSDKVINWGLSHNTKGLTPVAPKGGTELLKKYGGMFVCEEDEKAGNKKVYFTFDLGYEAGFTGEVLDILKQHSIKATFFLCGNYLQEEELIGRMIAEGHTIGNHTDKHKDLPKLGDEAMKKDVADFTEKFEAKYGAAYGKKISQFRPPKGRFDERVLNEVQDQGMHAIMWSSAIVDWGKSPIKAKPSAEKILKRVHPGAIMLFHITNSGTPEMLNLLIPQLHELGYSIQNAGLL